MRDLEKRIPEISSALGGEDDDFRVEVINRGIDGRILVRSVNSYRTFWVSQEEMDALGSYFPSLTWVNSSIN